MNDIHEASTNCKAIYADDTNLISPLCSFSNSASVKYMNMEEISVNINNELDSISEWLSINKLSLNVKKTKFMFCHFLQRNVNSFTLKLAINSELIETMTKFNFLGLTIDEHLNPTYPKYFKQNSSYHRNYVSPEKISADSYSEAYVHISAIYSIFHTHLGVQNWQNWEVAEESNSYRPFVQ